MKKLINNISIWSNILSFGYWFQLHPYCKQWDKKLNKLMKEHEFVIINKYTASIGGVKVWIGNHPYGSFNPYDPEIEIRPSRKTIYLAGERVKRLMGKRQELILSNFFKD